MHPPWHFCYRSVAPLFVIPSEAEGSAFCHPLSNPNGSAALPFVIPTGAKRSGGICGAPLGPPEFCVPKPKTDQTPACATPVENISKRDPLNRRSLGSARDDKGKSGASIGSWIVNNRPTVQGTLSVVETAVR